MKNTLKIDDTELFNKADLEWVYRLINMKISELSATRSGPTPTHALREAEELRSLSRKVWALEAAIISKKAR